MRKTGLLIDPVKGETALSVLNELDLVDRRFKVGRTKSKLRIPLARRPNVLELELIETRLGEFATAEEEFEPQPEKPESLEAALSLLPPEARASLPKAFDVIGDLAIVELAPETVAYQGLIAHALMTVHKNIKAVYSKAGPVSGEERVRPLKHLAGETRTSTIHKEFGCSFKVDIAKAFYSPRLSGEHQRVADLVEPGEHVIDMFAGVGPFPVLIAKRLSNVTVDAIDLNSEATRLLEENLRLNHVKGRVRVWNKDAREAILEDDLTGSATRVIMNHPSQARAFVDTACQAIRPTGGILHYYTFAEGLEAEAYAVSELEDRLEAVDWNIEETLYVRKVRGTSPMAWQIAVDARVGPA